MSEPKKQSSAVAEIMRKARTAGTATKGQISLDTRVAREKMKEFRLADPLSFGVEFFLAATGKGASLVVVQVAPSHFEMRFDGRPFSAADFENIYSDLFSGGDMDADRRAGGRLALGLNALSALNPDEVNVVSGDGREGAHLSFQPGKEDRIGPATDFLDGTRITVSLKNTNGFLFSPAERVQQIIALLSKQCAYSDVNFVVNGETVSRGFQLSDAAVSVSFTDDTLKGTAGLVPGSANGEVHFILEGVLVETVSLPIDFAGVQVIVQDTAFRKDLAGNRVIRNESHRRAMSESEKAAVLVLQRLQNRTAEMYVYETCSDSFGEEAFSVAGASFQNDGVKPFHDSKVKPFVPSKGFAPSEFYLSTTARMSAVLFRRVGRLFRPVVKAVYLSWLLLVPMLLGRVFSRSLSDWTTISFLLLIVVFFVMLSFLVLLHAIAGPHSKRKPYVQLHFDKFPIDDAAGLRGVDASNIQTRWDRPGAETEKRPLRVVGTVAIKDDDPTRDRNVFTDLWSASPHRAVRLTSCRSFTLRLDNNKETAVAVDLSDGTWVVGAYRQGSGLPVISPPTRNQLTQWMKENVNGAEAEDVQAGRFDSEFGGLEGLMSIGTGISIKEGDRLEIIAPAGTWTRTGEQETGLILSGDKQHPLIVSVVAPDSEREAAI